MKKRIFLTACVAFLTALCLFSCTPDTPDMPDEPDTPDSPSVDTGYTSIACRNYAAFHTLRFGKEGGENAISLALPVAWEPEPDEKGVAFYCEGKAVARIEARTAIENDYTRVKEELFGGEGFDIDVYVERKGEGTEAVYRRVIRFWYPEGEKEQALTLTADYAAISDESLQRVLNDAALLPAAAHGVLSLEEKEREEGISLLILGNSFIGSSQVGSLLNSMCAADGRQVTVHAISRGYAKVHTYVQDTALMAEIERGQYDVVLQCGFYDAAEKGHLAAMYEACAVSGTALVLFPAHNENASVIAAVKEAYPDLLLLDWKGEVQSFIDGGASLWDLCIDDGHRHSTPLAGYVGAHMIYRAVFGEAPDTIPSFMLNNVWVGEEYVTEVLGEEYVTRATYPILADFWCLP